MVVKEKLIELIIKLQNSAINRKTNQGVSLYTNTLDELNGEISNDDLFIIHNNLCTSLSGINAHGYFNDEEYKYFKKIWQMRKS